MTVDPGEQQYQGCCRIFLCHLRGLGVWIKFQTAAGNMYSHSSVCNLINFQSFGEQSSDFFVVSVGLAWLNTVGTDGPGCAWLEPQLDLHFHLCPRSGTLGAPEVLGFCTVLKQSSFTPAPYYTQVAPLLGWCFLSELPL